MNSSHQEKHDWLNRPRDNNVLEWREREKEREGARERGILLTWYWHVITLMIVIHVMIVVSTHSSSHVAEFPNINQLLISISVKFIDIFLWFWLVPDLPESWMLFLQMQDLDRDLRPLSGSKVRVTAVSGGGVVFGILDSNLEKLCGFVAEC